MIPADLLELLRCPETRQPLTVADVEALARINASGPTAGPVADALVREDGKIAYPVSDGIPVLLVDAAIALL